LKLSAVLPVILLAAACSAGPDRPADLDTKTEICRSCRMPISDPRLAAQLTAPRQEPAFFDDIVCLRDFLARSPVPEASVAYVADHRTKAWVRASKALYTRAAIETPMGSHWIAHADAASRDADPAAKSGVNVAASDIFGPPGPPDGGRGAERR
jgi:copper chaperone NosL